MKLGCAKTSPPFSLLLFHGFWHPFTVKPQKQLRDRPLVAPVARPRRGGRKRGIWEALLHGCDHASTMSAVPGPRARLQSNLGLLLIITVK